MYIYSSRERPLRPAYPALNHFHAFTRVDEDFTRAGEMPYCGAFTLREYKQWLKRLDGYSRGVDLPYGYQAYEILLMIDELGEIAALGQIRMDDRPPATTWAGHIGYSVPPSKRGRGYATRTLIAMLEECRARGKRSVLLTCDPTNLASKRVIEKCGGVFQDTFTGGGYIKLRYLFTL